MSSHQPSANDRLLSLLEDSNADLKSRNEELMSQVSKLKRKIDEANQTIRKMNIELSKQEEQLQSTRGKKRKAPSYRKGTFANDVNEFGQRTKKPLRGRYAPDSDDEEQQATTTYNSEYAVPRKRQGEPQSAPPAKRQRTENDRDVSTATNPTAIPVTAPGLSNVVLPALVEFLHISEKTEVHFVKPETKKHVVVAIIVPAIRGKKDLYMLETIGPKAEQYPFAKELLTKQGYYSTNSEAQAMQMLFIRDEKDQYLSLWDAYECAKKAKANAPAPSIRVTDTEKDNKVATKPKSPVEQRKVASSERHSTTSTNAEKVDQHKKSHAKPINEMQEQSVAQHSDDDLDEEGRPLPDDLK